MTKSKGMQDSVPRRTAISRRKQTPSYSTGLHKVNTPSNLTDQFNSMINATEIVSSVQLLASRSMAEQLVVVFSGFGFCRSSFSSLVPVYDEFWSHCRNAVHSVSAPCNSGLSAVHS